MIINRYARFMKFVDMSGDHWIWKGGDFGEAYCAFYWSPEEGQVYAHVASHRLFIGPVPEGYEVDHKCFETKCVHPDHLEAVTREVNMARRRQIGPRVQEFCKRGHEMAVWATVRKSGKRYCRKCQNDKRRAERMV